MPGSQHSLSPVQAGSPEAERILQTESSGAGGSSPLSCLGPGPEPSAYPSLTQAGWWEGAARVRPGWRDGWGEAGALTSPLLAVRFCRAPAQASRVASFLLLPMRFR